MLPWYRRVQLRKLPSWVYYRALISHSLPISLLCSPRNIPDNGHLCDRFHNVFRRHLSRYISILYLDAGLSATRARRVRKERVKSYSQFENPPVFLYLCFSFSSSVSRSFPLGKAQYNCPSASDKSDGMSPNYRYADPINIQPTHKHAKGFYLLEIYAVTWAMREIRPVGQSSYRIYIQRIASSLLTTYNVVTTHYETIRYYSSLCRNNIISILGDANNTLVNERSFAMGMRVYTISSAD